MAREFASASDTDAVNTVDRIIDAALDEIAAHGPTRARMSVIAGRAGVSSATLYRRFAAKQDLLQAAAIREVERFTGEMRQVAARQETAESAVVECFAFAADYLRQRTIFHDLIEAEPELILPQLTTAAGPLIDSTVRMILEVNEANLFVTRERWRREIAEVRIEMVVRIFVSLLLTPGGSIDITTPQATREFAQRHLVPLIVQADSPQATRPIALAPD